MHIRFGLMSLFSFTIHTTQAELCDQIVLGDHDLGSEYFEKISYHSLLFRFHFLPLS